MACGSILPSGEPASTGDHPQRFDPNMSVSILASRRVFVSNTAVRPKLFKFIWIALAALTAWSSGAATTYVTSNVKPPPPRREFRAAWIATVGNSVWPSQPDLPVSEQKAELVAIVDRAA